MGQKLATDVAMDCEMVGDDQNHKMLARVSIVDVELNCIYDKYVKPTRDVRYYRTVVSGIRPEDLENGEPFETVRKEVAAIINGRILVGHSIHFDLDVLCLSHPQHMIQDIQSLEKFKALTFPHPASLKQLARRFLNTDIQRGEHSSVEDAVTTMRLYLIHPQL